MWGLLRIWHVEVLSSVATVADANLFARTSYCVAPDHWRTLSPRDLDNRIGVLLQASYAQRNEQTDDPTPMWLVAFDREWVEREDMPGLPSAVDGVVAPNTEIASTIVDRAIAELDVLRAQPRPGLTAKAWERAFSAWRVDPDGERWHVLKHAERDGAFAERLS